MGFKIRNDLFKVWRGQTDEKGQKLEAEEQTVQHVFQGSAPVSMRGAGVAGEIPLEIIGHATALEVAKSVSATCRQCKHFNRTAWLKMLSVADNPGSSAGERHSVNEIRMNILMKMPEADDHIGADGEYDVEHALKSMGMCRPLAEFYQALENKPRPEIIGVWPGATCPKDVVSPDKPFGLFEPKDGDARREGKAAYDHIMNTAAGKI